MELIRLRTNILEPNFDLLEGMLSGFKTNKQHLSDGDIIIVNSKIVAVSQNRVVELNSIKQEIQKNAKNPVVYSHYGSGKEDPRFTALVQQEADYIVPPDVKSGPRGNMLLTIKNGIFTPAAGIDRSNSPEGTVVLWPEKPWDVAWKLYGDLKKYFKVKQCGVIIVDSTCNPLRAGTSGVALAWAGFKGVEDVRGKKDIYKKPLTVTRKAVADNLASSAQILMGEANEQVPLVLIRKAPVKFTTTKPKTDEGSIPMKECLYSGLYKHLK